MLVDACGRTIDYLRISVIDRCDLRCVYCTPEEGVTLLPREDILSYEEMLAFSATAVEEGIRKIRLTGGEPLVRRDVIGFIERMRKIPGLEDLSMTTNAMQLEEYGDDLYRVGLRRLNIGVDTLDAETFRRITRIGDIRRVMAGLKKAVDVGFSPIKLNVVVLKGINEDLSPFVKLTYEYPVFVRFIEYMPVSNGLKEEFYVPCGEIKKRLAAFGRAEDVEAPAGGGPAARYVRLPGAVGAIGLICAMSEHFCSTCTRLRLTADGKLRVCLFSDDEVDVTSVLRPRPDKAGIVGALRRAVAVKPAEYKLVKRDRNGRRMSQIGG